MSENQTISENQPNLDDLALENDQTADTMDQSIDETIEESIDESIEESVDGTTEEATEQGTNKAAVQAENQKPGKAAVFQTRVTEKDLMDFKLYHNYSSVSGIATLLFGIIALVIFVVTLNQVNISYTLMMGFFGVFFTIYTPIGMRLKVRKQMKKVAALKDPVVYTVTEEKIALQQGEVKEEMLWDDVFKIRSTGKSLILYITTVRANIIPIKSLGNQAELFFEIASKKLTPYQIKLNQDKVIRQAEATAEKL